MAKEQHHVISPLLGTVFRVSVKAGDEVRASQEIVIIESMKMEHPVEAGVDGIVESVLVGEGDTIAAGQKLFTVTPAVLSGKADDRDAAASGGGERADLARYRERRHLTTDAARPDAVARRRAKNQRTARENIDDHTVRRVVTADSTAWTKASRPVKAVTRRGCDTVRAGSSRAMRAAAFGSRQAILWWVASSAMSAALWHSLPVPAVVGMAMSGSMGRVALPTPW